MNKDQLETDLRRMVESLKSIRHQLELGKTGTKPNVDDLIEMLSGLQRDVMTTGMHQDISL